MAGHVSPRHLIRVTAQRLQAHSPLAWPGVEGCLGRGDIKTFTTPSTDGSGLALVCEWLISYRERNTKGAFPCGMTDLAPLPQSRSLAQHW